MRISPPIIVLAIMAATLACTVWLAPPQHESAQVTVTLSATTYQKLKLWGTEHPEADGRALTVVEVINQLANK